MRTRIFAITMILFMCKGNSDGTRNLIKKPKYLGVGFIHLMKSKNLSSAYFLFSDELKKKIPFNIFLSQSSFFFLKEEWPEITIIEERTDKPLLQSDGSSKAIYYMKYYCSGKNKKFILDMYIEEKAKSFSISDYQFTILENPKDLKPGTEIGKEMTEFGDFPKYASMLNESIEKDLLGKIGKEGYSAGISRLNSKDIKYENQESTIESVIISRDEEKITKLFNEKFAQYILSREREKISLIRKGRISPEKNILILKLEFKDKSINHFIVRIDPDKASEASVFYLLFEWYNAQDYYFF